MFPAERKDGPRKTRWYPARYRVRAKMSEFAGRSIEAFKPHDFRRTALSNTQRLKVDLETAEAMLISLIVRYQVVKYPVLHRFLCTRDQQCKVVQRIP